MKEEEKDNNLNEDVSEYAREEVLKKFEEFLQVFENSVVERITLQKNDFVELVKIIEEIIEKKVKERFNTLLSNFIDKM